MTVLERLTWHRCDRCGEPIDPANVLTKREPWYYALLASTPYGLAKTIRLHPGGAAGCMTAARALAQRDLDAAVERVNRRIAAAYGEPV